MGGLRKELGRRALQGAIERVTPDGFIEGWACDTGNVARVVEILVLAGTIVVATGTADRPMGEYSDVVIGHGWHGFRLALARNVPLDSPLRLSLAEASTRKKFGTTKLVDPADIDFDKRRSATDETKLPTDPTRVTTIDQLALVEPFLEQFIARNGVEEFVDRAYCYILGRPSDAGGRKSYAQHMTAGNVKPLEMLRILYETDERRSSNWDMFGPSSASFPFFVDATQ